MNTEEDEDVILTPWMIELGRVARYTAYQWLLGKDYEEVVQTLREAGWTEDYLTDASPCANLVMQSIKYEGLPENEGKRKNNQIAEYQKEFPDKLPPKPNPNILITPVK